MNFPYLTNCAPSSPQKLEMDPLVKLLACLEPLGLGGGQSGGIRIFEMDPLVKLLACLEPLGLGGDAVLLESITSRIEEILQEESLARSAATGRESTATGRESVAPDSERIATGSESVAPGQAMQKQLCHISAAQTTAIAQALKQEGVCLPKLMAMLAGHVESNMPEYTTDQLEIMIDCFNNFNISGSSVAAIAKQLIQRMPDWKDDVTYDHARIMANENHMGPTA
eukprot:gene7248-359_t